MAECRRVLLGGWLPPLLELKVRTLGVKPTAWANAPEFISVDRYHLFLKLMDKFFCVIKISDFFSFVAYPFELKIMSDDSLMPHPTHRMEDLSVAYQLRYHFGWYAYQRKPLFATENIQSLVQHAINEIAARYGYHVLAIEFESNAIRCLMSLVPSDCPSAVTRIVKGNLQSQLRGHDFGKLWSRGWFVRSNGNVCRETVESYVASQFGKHRAIPIRVPIAFDVPRFKNESHQVAIRTSDHAAYQNNFHFVFCVCGRAELIDSFIGKQLQNFWLTFLKREGWICSTMRILSDHVHFKLSLPLDVSPLTVAFRMLNNAEFWFAKRWSAALRIAELNSLFQSSYYVGTYGEATTAQIDSYLKNLTA